MTLLGLFDAPVVILRPGNCAPLPARRYAPGNSRLVLTKGSTTFIQIVKRLQDTEKLEATASL